MTNLKLSLVNSDLFAIMLLQALEPVMNISSFNKVLETFIKDVLLIFFQVVEQYNGAIE
jgi:hypothetical protein